MAAAWPPDCVEKAVGSTRQKTCRTSLKLTAKAPENLWLEDEISFWDGLCSGAMLVSEGVYDMDILYTCMHTYRVITLLIRVITAFFACWVPFCRFPFLGFAQTTQLG